MVCHLAQSIFGLGYLIISIDRSVHGIYVAAAAMSAAVVAMTHMRILWSRSCWDGCLSEPLTPRVAIASFAILGATC